MCTIQEKLGFTPEVVLGPDRHTKRGTGKAPTIKEIATPYDQTAETFLTGRKEHGSLFNAFVWPSFTKVLGQVVDQQIVDVGCGPGELAERMHQMGNHVYGVDISRGMLHVAHDTFPVDQFPGLTFIHASAAQMPLESSAYDLVTAIYVFNHMGNKEAEAAMNEAWRILKPGGRMVILDTHPNRNQLYYSQNNGKETFPEGWYAETWPESRGVYIPTFYRRDETWRQLVSNSPFTESKLYEPVAQAALAQADLTVYQHYSTKRLVIFDMIK